MWPSTETALPGNETVAGMLSNNMQECLTHGSLCLPTIVRCHSKVTIPLLLLGHLLSTWELALNTVNSFEAYARFFRTGSESVFFSHGAVLQDQLLLGWWDMWWSRFIPQASVPTVISEFFGEKQCCKGGYIKYMECKVFSKSTGEVKCIKEGQVRHNNPNPE